MNVRQSGVTLVELMVTVTVLGVVLTLGVPSLSQFLRAMEVDSAVKQISSGLAYARSEAVNRQRRVTVCPLADNASQDQCGNGWGRGMLVFENRNADAAFQAGTDELLKKVSYNSDAGISWSRAGFISYNKLGRSGTTGTFRIDPVPADNNCTQQEGCASLVLANSGRLRRG